MPYLHDQESTVENKAVGRWSSSGVQTFAGHAVDATRDRLQYGWRSRGEKEAAHANLLSTLSSSSSWSQQRQVILAMERVERSLQDPLVRSADNTIVHDRDYTDRRTSGKVQERSNIYYGLGSGNPVGSSTPWLSSTIMNPKLSVSESTQRSIGGQMMRQSIPTAPQANLGQWFGELRDANRLFQGGRLRDASSWGGGYLNWQFGWKGFVGEIQKAAEAILDSEALVEDFLLNSSKLIHRTRERILSQGTHSSTITGYSDSYTNKNSTIQTPVCDVSVGWNTYSGMSSSYGPRMRIISTTVWTQVLRTFALWEYFAFDPEKALERLPAYYQQARQLLGSSLVSASTLYELAPWSWMTDWFYDVGGLLSYQESVASDSLVSRRTGSVFEYSISNHLIADFQENQRYGNRMYGYNFNSFADLRFQRRRPGTPYDMGNSWNGFSTSQWFILGALGLTKAPKTPL